MEKEKFQLYAQFTYNPWVSLVGIGLLSIALVCFLILLYRVTRIWLKQIDRTDRKHEKATTRMAKHGKTPKLDTSPNFVSHNVHDDIAALHRSFLGQSPDVWPETMGKLSGIIRRHHDSVYTDHTTFETLEQSQQRGIQPAYLALRKELYRIQFSSQITQQECNAVFVQAQTVISDVS